MAEKVAAREAEGVGIETFLWQELAACVAADTASLLAVDRRAERVFVWEPKGVDGVGIGWGDDQEVAFGGEAGVQLP